ncbi:MAG: pilus assembly protein TadG-related protein [Terracidiphilus sp.]|jgi:Flp pilus assembly protein TadG
MTSNNRITLHRALKEQRGQVLPWVALMMGLFLGMGAFVLDVGHAYICYHQLQAATDAAALAGAKQVYYSTALSTATNYSGSTGTSGAPNNYPSLQNVTIVSSTTKCLSTIVAMGILCEGPNTANAVQVVQSATIPTFFAQVFGINQLKLYATATAAKGKPVPLNVALLIDTTLSMDDEDANCGNTQLGCAMSGAQTLLAGLAPTLDAVSVFTFPNVSPATVSNDTSCSPPQSLNPSFYSYPTAGLATSVPYTFPTIPSTASTGYTVSNGGTYQITSFSNSYRNSNASTTPNANDPVVQAVGQPAKNGNPAVGACLAPPNQAGEFGTYLAGVIYAAQAALAQEKAAEISALPVNSPTPINIMIILSDGNTNASPYYGFSNQFFTPNVTLNTNGVYPAGDGDCGQEVVAATTAKGDGTQIFTIAYGSPATGTFSWNPNDPGDSVNNAGCPTDQDSFFSAFHLGSNVSAYPNIAPCTAMKDMASPDTAAIQYFYSDYLQSGSNSTCYSSVTDSPTNLTDIFASIVGSLSKARLIPDNTQ